MAVAEGMAAEPVMEEAEAVVEGMAAGMEVELAVEVMEVAVAVLEAGMAAEMTTACTQGEERAAVMVQVRSYNLYTIKIVFYFLLENNLSKTQFIPFLLYAVLLFRFSFDI